MHFNKHCKAGQLKSLRNPLVIRLFDCTIFSSATATNHKNVSIKWLYNVPSMEGRVQPPLFPESVAEDIGGNDFAGHVVGASIQEVTWLQLSY